jgi:hypothetical protein
MLFKIIPKNITNFFKKENVKFWREQGSAATKPIDINTQNVIKQGNKN